MERFVQHLLRIQNDRIIFRENEMVSDSLPVLWLIALLFLGHTVVSILLEGWAGYQDGKVIAGNVAAFAAIAFLSFLYNGGFVINRTTNEVRRLGFASKASNFEGALGVGFRHEIRRVLIKGYHDELDVYSLFFPMWNDTELPLWTVYEKDRALRMQTELAEFLHLKALPMQESASEQNNETYR